ncbi:MAG: hypothetical protein ACYDAC_08275 [Candidatus Dormibacteria bacterium]
MKLRSAIPALLAAVWCAIALLISAHLPPGAGLLPSLSAASGPPAPGGVAALVAWTAAAVCAAVAVADSIHTLSARRPRFIAGRRLLVVAAGALVLAAGLVAQLESYRVCCAPPGPLTP